MAADEVRAMLTEIASRHGLFKCQECSIEMVKALKNRGSHGKRVQLSAKDPKWCAIQMRNLDFRLPFACPTNNISENGQHYGVVVEGIAYCNIFRSGIPWEQWVRSFFCHGDMFCVSTLDEF